MHAIRRAGTMKATLRKSRDGVCLGGMGCQPGDATRRRAQGRPAMTTSTNPSKFYIVPTDRWYIERSVWFVAGLVLLGTTAMAALVHALWVLGVVVTAASSILVAFTGFCIVGNALARLGFEPKLAREGWSPGDWYFMQTDSWYLERRIYLAVGVNLLVASSLSLLHSPWWLAFTGFVGAAMVWFAATGFCIMANALYWLGAEPRLVPGAGATRRAAAVARGKALRAN
jgi:Protein of unknown function (DUF2892)